MSEEKNKLFNKPVKSIEIQTIEKKVVPEVEKAEPMIAYGIDGFGCRVYMAESKLDKVKKDGNITGYKPKPREDVLDDDGKVIGRVLKK